MSDTHGESGIIEIVKERHADCDIVIHCGDSELSYDHQVLQNVVKVRGNCDYTDNRFLDEEVVKVAHATIFVTHGHLYNVKTSLLPLSYRAQEQQADICCFGHSHILGAEMIDGILMINPGSLVAPRGRTAKSYCVVTMEKERFIVQCFQRNGVEIAQFIFEREK